MISMFGMFGKLVTSRRVSQTIFRTHMTSKFENRGKRPLPPKVFSRTFQRHFVWRLLIGCWAEGLSVGSADWPITVATTHIRFHRNVNKHKIPSLAALHCTLFSFCFIKFHSSSSFHCYITSYTLSSLCTYAGRPVICWCTLLLTDWEREDFSPRFW